MNFICFFIYLDNTTTDGGRHQLQESPISLNPASNHVAGLKNDHLMTGVLEQVTGGESGDARTHNDDLFPLPLTPFGGKPIPEEVKENVRPLPVWVAVPGAKSIYLN